MTTPECKHEHTVACKCTACGAYVVLPVTATPNQPRRYTFTIPVWELTTEDIETADTAYELEELSKKLTQGLNALSSAAYSKLIAHLVELDYEDFNQRVRKYTQKLDELHQLTQTCLHTKFKPPEQATDAITTALLKAGIDSEKLKNLIASLAEGK